MEYKVQDLTREQTGDIYRQWIGRHFPQDEIKPLKSIYRMWDMGAYRALGMYEKKADGLQLIGYAFFAMAEDCGLLLLDYLAIVEDYRGQGMGSIFLQEMKKRLKTYRGILIETEDIECAGDEEAYRIRQKRDSFYGQNGALRTGIKSVIYGVHYAIWNFPLASAASRRECAESLADIYKIVIPGEKYDKFVKIAE